MHGTTKFQRKSFTMHAGETLPATRKYKKNKFIFTVGRDLKVVMNKTK
jgi:hypothetical protein